jgi:hypothetical protein
MEWLQRMNEELNPVDTKDFQFKPKVRAGGNTNRKRAITEARRQEVQQEAGSMD